MATDTVLAVPRPDNRAILSHYQSDLARQRRIGIGVDDQESSLQFSTSGPEASTGHDPSPSSPDPARVKNDSFSVGAVHRHKQSQSGTDNRTVPIVPLKASDTVPKEDETSQYLPSAQATLPSLSPSAGRRALVVDAQLAVASGPALVTVAPEDRTNLYSSPQDPSLTPSSHSPTTPKSSHPPSSASSAKYGRSRNACGSIHARSSSRDIGIVGTVTVTGLPQDFSTLPDQGTPSKYRPPIFQTPSTRSSSPDIATPVGTPVELDPAVQTPSSGTAHVRPSTMSTSVEPIHSASPASPAMNMNGHEVRAQPHSVHVLTTSSPRHQLVNSHEQRTATSPVSSPTLSSPPSSYLYYQPGVHSKAGPLPPPPRAMFDIDFNAPPPPRPPRLRSPSPLTSLKSPGPATPTSVTVRLASKASTASIHQIHISATPPLSITKSKSSSEVSDYSPEPEAVPTDPDQTVHHTREGAFPPSTITTPAERPNSQTGQSTRLVPDLPSKGQLPSLPTDILDSAPVISVHPADDALSPDTASSLELHRKTNWVSNSNDSSHVSSEGSQQVFEDARPALKEMNGSYPSIREFAPEGSPLEPTGKGGVLIDSKRNSSLPRTPSSKSPRVSIYTRSPSPASLPKPRIRARSPDAMRFKDVLNKRTALERAIGYANKINELSMYDCGLGDWVTLLKERGSSKTRLVPASPSRQNSDRSPAPRARHTSKASISSEMTFPLRADAYIATDLSQRDIDTVPSPNVPPPALPYPALAGITSTANARHSTTTIGSQLSHAAPLSAAASKATGGFFSSLGRSSSTRRDSLIRPTTTQPTAARLTKQPSTTTAPNPRPVQLTSAPSVPGGPRALPNRVQRSRTLMLAPSSSSSSPASSERDAAAGASSSSFSSSRPVMRRRSNTLRRPSFFGRSTAGPSPPEIGISTSPEFSRQVERLADLLPHANKDVLAGYLRRAGQDILAIGQYLEDQKNGSIRAP
ncbi:hypothetical protein BC827DRAFT_400151 [Russula dissimulans]|nr:hypothetical protein BC827DRAFT_400151 [Russula dissimulans]